MEYKIESSGKQATCLIHNTDNKMTKLQKHSRVGKSTSKHVTPSFSQVQALCQLPVCITWLLFLPVFTTYNTPQDLLAVCSYHLLSNIHSMCLHHCQFRE
jgi:hypothetical protein